MQRCFLKSKLHRATITSVDIHYEGSIGIDRAFMDAVGLLPYEQVDVAVIDNGARFTTYVIEEPEGSGRITINGAAGRLCDHDMQVIIMGYAMLDASEIAGHQPKVVTLGAHNALPDMAAARHG